jgi:multidrug efflux pump subunit AcrA (membrane-fusion protein)
MVVDAHPYVNKLFYSGTVQPLKTHIILGPASGTVVEMPIQYGEVVKQGQLLFVLSSSKFLADYKSALIDYLRAKSDFNNNQTQLNAATFLHKNELISDDDFKAKKTNYYGSQLALLQAKDALESLIQQLDIKGVNFYKLSMADVDKVTEVMHLHVNSENLRITAPLDGVLLSPSKTQEENKKIVKDNAVKQDEPLAIIGDMTGIRVSIRVNELIVNQLHAGQKVNVTGIAFPEDVLEGRVSRVDRQGETTNGGLATFAAEVVVPALTKNQQQRIHVGMSAKVEIDMIDESEIRVPILAVNEKNNIFYVKIYDDKQSKVREAVVKTGKTTTDSVVIVAGLKSGDKIVIPD